MIRGRLEGKSLRFTTIRPAAYWSLTFTDVKKQLRWSLWKNQEFCAREVELPHGRVESIPERPTAVLLTGMIITEIYSFARSKQDYSTWSFRYHARPNLLYCVDAVKVREVCTVCGTKCWIKKKTYLPKKETARERLTWKGLLTDKNNFIQYLLWSFAQILKECKVWHLETNSNRNQLWWFRCAEIMPITDVMMMELTLKVQDTG